MTSVTLLIFSGRPDPTWELAAGAVSKLAPLFRNIGSAPELSTLGYRGFFVRSDDAGMPPETIVHNAPELERLLLRTSDGRVSPEIIAVVEAAITGRRKRPR